MSFPTLILIPDNRIDHIQLFQSQSEQEIRYILNLAPDQPLVEKSIDPGSEYFIYSNERSSGPINLLSRYTLDQFQYRGPVIVGKWTGEMSRRDIEGVLRDYLDLSRLFAQEYGLDINIHLLAQIESELAWLEETEFLREMEGLGVRERMR
jgi:hypothetical protein